jgi:ubiquinone/menaquinone biosynthesis C-methylase UbiE
MLKPNMNDSQQLYSTPDVVQIYAKAATLLPTEKHLLTHFLKPNMRILDLGVGGGRTTPFLAEHALEYVGVDYATAMVEACRQRFAHLRFETMDAANLSAFADDHFDLVMFSYNGLGNMHPDAQRIHCLQECYRVLKPGGTLIFSLHYSRSLFFRPPLTVGLRPFVASLWQSLQRFFTRIVQPFFWNGSGYFYAAAHGGMLLHQTTPAIMHTTLQKLGFSDIAHYGEEYPARNIPCLTRWYYYSALK